MLLLYRQSKSKRSSSQAKPVRRSSRLSDEKADKSVKQVVGSDPPSHVSRQHKDLHQNYCKDQESHLSAELDHQEDTNKNESTPQAGEDLGEDDIIQETPSCKECGSAFCCCDLENNSDLDVIMSQLENDTRSLLTQTEEQYIRRTEEKAIQTEDLKSSQSIDSSSFRAEMNRLVAILRRSRGQYNETLDSVIKALLEIADSESCPPRS